MAKKRRKKKNKTRQLSYKKLGKPTLSLCMIVKDEEEFLPRCLRSVKDFVDEIIVVDTGSTDTTVEIAKSFGAKVYHHPWEKDFSKHRNQSIGYATKDWILILDADEEFFIEDGPGLRAILHDTEADYFYLQCHDLESSGKLHGIFNQIRVFRNGLGMHYTQAVHNQLQTRGRGKYTQLRFRHYGYDLSPEKMDEKHERTTSLLYDMINSDPDEPYFYYQLAASYSMHREPEKAIEYGEQAIKMMRARKLKNEYFVTVFYIVAQAYFSLGKLDHAERICIEATQFNKLDLDAYHTLAAIYFKLRDKEKCKQASFNYLKIYEILKKHPEKMQGIYVHSFGKIDEVYFGLGCLSFIEGNVKACDEYFTKCFHTRGKPSELAEKIATFFLDNDRPDYALKWVTDYLEGEKTGGQELVKRLLEKYLRIYGRQATLSSMDQLINRRKDFADLWFLRGDLFTKLGMFAEASESYKRALELKADCDPSIYTKAMKAFETVGRNEQARLIGTEGLKVFRENNEILLELAKIEISEGQYEKAYGYLLEVNEHELDEEKTNLKKMISVVLFWNMGDFYKLASHLEQISASLQLDRRAHMGCDTDLARMLFDISKKYCFLGQWSSAELALELASKIDSSAINAHEMAQLIQSA